MAETETLPPDMSATQSHIYGTYTEHIYRQLKINHVNKQVNNLCKHLVKALRPPRIL